MPGEPESTEDPQMAKLMHRWGQHARAPGAARADGLDDRPPGRLFEPPGDLSALHRALDAVDEEIARPPARPVFAGSSSRWVLRGLGLAASLAIVAGTWWFFDRLRGQPREELPLPPVLADVSLSAHSGILRGEPVRRFRSGERVYLQFTADRPGWAAVALLDSQLRLSLIPGAERLAVVKGHNSLGPFELDDRPGTESFVVLGSGRPPDTQGSKEWLRKASDAIPPGTSAHAEALEVVLANLGTADSITVGVCTFEHVAR